MPLCVGGGALSLSDLTDASLGGAVTVDSSALEKLKSPPGKGPAPPLLPPLPPASPITSPAQLSTAQTRAVLVTAANQLLLGRSGVRPDVVSWLLSLLESSSLPSLAPGSIGVALAAAAQGAGQWVDASGASVAAPSTTAPGVTAGDLLALLSLSTAAPASIGGVAVHAAAALLPVADAVACVSIEAVQAPCGALDTDYNDAARPLPGQMASAGVMRLLLEGSGETGKAAATAASSVACCETFTAAHQVHGGAYACITAATRLLSADVNAAIPVTIVSQGDRKGGNAAAVIALANDVLASISRGEDAAAVAARSFVSVSHAASLCAALEIAREGVDALMHASRARLNALRTVELLHTGGAAASAPAPSSNSTIAVIAPSSVDSASASATAGYLAVDLQVRIDELTAAFAAELDVANAMLSARENAAAIGAAEKLRAKAAAAAAREVSEAARVAAMGAEERAKWEEANAKRREKAAKREGGADAPVATPAAVGNANVLGMGAGTFDFRAHVAALSSTGACGGSTIAALSPFFPSALGLSLSTSLAPISPAATPTALPRCNIFLRTLLDRLAAGGVKRKPKIARGTRDFLPEQMEVREACFNTVRSVFKRHGAVELDTPVFELRETLLGKYGEEGAKLVYDLADQGGELLSLRYDLTVPFARFLAMNSLESLKRFHIARVYRRDTPQIARGRYREFYQCDFDIAGSYGSMLPDAEVLKVACEILSALPIGPFAIKLNHRKLLDAALAIAGVPSSKFRSVCSSIDKLDKEPWSSVREELIDDKGLPPPVADAVGVLVQRSGTPVELLRELVAEGRYGADAGGAIALSELGTVLRYLTSLGCVGSITLDLSLARGLDYYTGLIYEAVLLDPSVGVGSIAAGGRYDNLVGVFSAPGTVVPCVGVSIGLERVFAIMEAKAAATAAAAAAEAGTTLVGSGLRRTPVCVWVASIPTTRGRDMASERLSLLGELWAAGFSAEALHAVGDPKLQKQLTAALEAGAPFVAVLGEDECDNGLVQLKDLAAHTSEAVPRAGLVAALREKGARELRVGVCVGEKA